LRTLYSVQYLRGIAALLVVVCHGIGFINISGVTTHYTSSSIEYFGAIGVDIFFVISGFIITYTSGNEVGGYAAAAFAKKRFIRIVPVYYIASALYLVRYLSSRIFSFIPPPHVVIDKLTILKTITILPLFDKKESLPTILTLAWTLSYELLFYIIFVVLILLKINKREYWLLSILIGLTILGTIFPTQNIQWEFLTNYMVLEFGFGVILCLLYQRWNRLSFSFFVSLTVLSLLLFVLLIWSGRNHEIAGYGLEVIGPLPIYRVLFWGIPSALFVAGLVFMEKAKPGSIKKNRWMLLLGDASYSIYLTHGLAYMAVGMLINHFVFLKQTQPDLFLILSIVFALITGVVFYKFIERPVLKKMNRLLLKNKTILTTT
jgi:exopolysaccharide production protein ExoZ